MESRVTKEEVLECISRGAILLDIKKPCWFEDVDFTKLDMDSATWCVLAQLHNGSYTVGRSTYFTDEEARDGATQEHGFLLPLTHSKENNEEYQEVLNLYNNAWTNEILRRLGMPMMV